LKAVKVELAAETRDLVMTKVPERSEVVKLITSNRWRLIMSKLKGNELRTLAIFQYKGHPRRESEMTFHPDSSQSRLGCHPTFQKGDEGKQAHLWTSQNLVTSQTRTRINQIPNSHTSSCIDFEGPGSSMEHLARVQGWDPGTWAEKGPPTKEDRWIRGERKQCPLLLKLDWRLKQQAQWFKNKHSQFNHLVEVSKRMWYAAVLRFHCFTFARK
jgi:hypothetical protein